MKLTGYNIQTAEETVLNYNSFIEYETFIDFIKN